jgi:CHAT domain-containing protein
MTRFVLVLLLLGLTGVGAPAASALAQSATGIADEQQPKAAEFERLYQRSQSRDPEEVIDVVRRALKLAAELDPWPFGDPREYMTGMLHLRLGDAYSDRRQGKRADNLEQSINAFQEALALFRDDRHRAIWAETQNHLGIVFRHRIRGDRALNLEHSIAAYEAALTVFTREDFPSQWGMVQNNVGIAYSNRIRGNQAENIERSIKAYEDALTVRTRAEFPEAWARTQINLGVTYVRRVRGNRSDNVEQAITAYKAGGEVFTRERFAENWATVQLNLGDAYAARIAGERPDNLELAIKAYGDALTVYTRSDFPEDWADIQVNLGLAYTDRVAGTKVENLERAIAAYEASLTVYSPAEAWPLKHLLSSRLLGQALLETRDWRGASEAFAAAREAFHLMFGEGVDETEGRDLITQAGTLFADAAYAAVQNGELETALSLVNEGKARLLAVTLRQQALDLPPDKRARHAALKTEIRELSRLAEATTGMDRAAALERLTALRNELRELIESARGKEMPGEAVAAASALVSEGGAIIAPVVTKVGAKILIVTASPGGKTSIRPLDLAGLTSARLDQIVRGDVPGVVGGWRGNYEKNYRLVKLATEIEALAFLASLFPDLFADKLREAQEEFDRLDQEWRDAIVGIAELGSFFVGPLEATLGALGVKPGARLIWMPTGALGHLPLGLAREAADKPALAERYEIVYAPNLQALRAAQRQIAASTSASVAVIANPTGDLKYAEMEAAVVAGHFDPDARKVLDRSNGTRDAVVAELSERSYWHFSTHGKFSWEDARQSALSLRDQALTVGELLEMSEIKGLKRPRLVALSACETGLYDLATNPDEFTGFPGTFMALGAAGVLSTLWPVEDRATMLLMAKFYDLHRNGGLTPPAALKGAQGWLRTASKDELLAYAKSKLDPDKFAILAKTFQDDRIQVRYGVVISRPSAASRGTDPKLAVTTGPPFAHPFYWAAFIYDGL